MERQNHVAIIGQGYVGLPLAIELVKSGYTVFGIDRNELLIANLLKGISHLEEVTNEDLIQLQGSKKYYPSVDFQNVSQCATIVICVPTPLDEVGNPDLDFLISAAQSLTQFVMPGTLIINESTSFPGTLREVIFPIFPEQIRSSLHFAIAPERINPGSSRFSFKEIPRVVSGMSQEATLRAKVFYESLNLPVKIVSSPEVAEYAKLLENSFRFINIGFINELAELTACTGVDIFEVIDAASSKPFGFMPFFPSIGVGGHCIPVDPIYLSYYASRHNKKMDSIRIAENTNSNIHEFTISRIKSLLGVENRILIYGVAYKEGVRDLRESPSLLLMDKLSDEGFQVFYFDDLIDNVEGYKVFDSDAEYDLMVYCHGRSILRDLLTSPKIKDILDCSGNLELSAKVHRLFSLR